MPQFFLFLRAIPFNEKKKAKVGPYKKRTYRYDKKMMKNKMRYFFCLCLLLSACARAPLKTKDQAMRETSSKIELQDMLSKESFFSTLKKHIEVMKRSKQVTDPMIFGELKIAKNVYIAELEKILEHENDINWLSYIQEHFICLEVYGKDHWGDVLSTGYYEPLVRGSHTATKEFSEALYKTPPDLIAVDLKLFRGNKKHDGLPELLYGRLKNQTLVPYFDRKSIDREKVLEGKNLELAWVDPIDAFFIQIQGSAVIDFGNDEKMRVGYANQNGHTYMSIGK